MAGMRYLIFCFQGLLLGLLLGGEAWAGQRELADGSKMPLLHPKVFQLAGCWLSDTEAPVVTEINLDAVARNRNQFDMSEVKENAGWIRYVERGSEGATFLSAAYHPLGRQGERWDVLYAENGGGSLTVYTRIGFVIETREMRVGGKPVKRTMLKIVSWEPVREDAVAKLLAQKRAD